MEAKTPDHVPMSVHRVLLDASPPVVIHHLSWARGGTEILLEVGYFDLLQVHEELNEVRSGEATGMEVDWFVSNRFILSIETARRMLASLSQLTELVRKAEEAATFKRKSSKGKSSKGNLNA